jgi:hypothetical protein
VKAARQRARQNLYKFARRVVSDLQTVKARPSVAGSPQKQIGTFQAGCTSYKGVTVEQAGYTVMAKKPSIKIIKRKERDERAAQVGATAEVAVKKSAQETARDMVATVTEWVNEFQQKRRNETSQALKTLISDTPHLTEA